MDDVELKQWAFDRAAGLSTHPAPIIEVLAVADEILIWLKEDEVVD